MNRTKWGARAGALALLGLLVLPITGAMQSALPAQSPEKRIEGVAVRLLGPAGTLRGELVAATPDGIWIRDQSREFVLVPLDQVQEARVRRHNWTSRRILTWTGIAGGLTSVGMLAACTAFEDPDSGGCGGVLVGWALAWLAVGGVSAALVSPAWQPVSPRNSEGLRPWARFPQGLPAGFPPDASDALMAPDTVTSQPPGGAPARPPSSPGVTGRGSMVPTEPERPPRSRARWPASGPSARSRGRRGRHGPRERRPR